MTNGDTSGEKIVVTNLPINKKVLQMQGFKAKVYLGSAI